MIFENAAGSAAEDDRRGSFARREFGFGFGPSDHFAVDSEFADTANDQLGVLTAKVDDKDLLMDHARLQCGRLGREIARRTCV